LRTDLLAYSLRSGSEYTPAPYNVTFGLLGWSQYRLVIDPKSFVTFVSLGGVVLLSCLAIVAWTVAWDTATVTTLYPEIDFAAGFTARQDSDGGREQGAVISSLLYKDSLVVAGEMERARFHVVDRNDRDKYVSSWTLDS
jgi:hypothetical protein